MNTLQKICADKAEHVARMKSERSLSDLKSIIGDIEKPRGFLKNLKTKTPSLIAEVKKASPSKGVIRENFDPVEIAKTYEMSGASCLSVLTDAPYFQGDDDYLISIKDSVALPILRKDFMIDPYQIFESRALGADCILLIMAALSDDAAKTLYALATDLGMDVLVEVHNQEELERSLSISPMMLGVNNRNLKTLDVDVQTSFDLKKMIPNACHAISESGIFSHETICDLHSHGYNSFLVGESLMRQDDIGAAVKNLMYGTSS